MKLTPVETLKLQERIHSIIKAFGERETWTPAEGAMLVSGVRPPSQGIETLPEQAMQLLNEGFAATQPQMLHARRVLEEWNEDRDYDREDGGTMFDADPTPGRFVEWCDEAFSPKPRSFRPSWLEQFAFVALGSQSELPPPLPTELIDEMRAALHQASSSNVTDATTKEAEIAQAKRTEAWRKFASWAERKSTSPARVVVLAALRKLEPLEERVRFLVTDVQLSIKELKPEETRGGLLAVRSVEGAWEFDHLLPDHTKEETCTRDGLFQMLGRWQGKYDEFEREVK
jgi:hypothetical protein